MKFEMKSLVVAAALVAAGAANAAAVTGNVGQAVVVSDPAGSGRQAELTLLTGSSGTLTFSNCDSSFCYDGSDPSTAGGLISALNAGQVTIEPVSPATGGELRQDETDILSRYSAFASAPVTSVTADDQTGQVLRVGSAGGAKQTGVRNSTLTGGFASVTNLSFDLVNRTVSATLFGVKSAVGTRPAVTYDLGTQTLWTIGTLTGPTTIPPSALTAADPVAAMSAEGFTNIQRLTDARGVYYTAEANNQIGDLRVTTVGFDFFKNSLGLTNAGISALTAVQSYGDVNSVLKFSVREVPEPSTYAMMAIGLVGLGFAARRRAK